VAVAGGLAVGVRPGLVPRRRGVRWIITAFLLGSSAGAAVAGELTNRQDTSRALALGPLAAAAVGLVLAAGLVATDRRRTGAISSSGDRPGR
jgi:MFS family permease